jgi:chlorobactene glucosyltransferase
LLAWISRRGPVRGKVITSSEVGAATLLELGPLLAYHISIDKEVRVPWYYAFAYPLAAFLFEIILAQSTWRVLLRKGVDWRGRQYYK